MRRVTTALLVVPALACQLVPASAPSAFAAGAGPTGNATLVISTAQAQRLAERGIEVEGARGADTTGRETRLQIDGGAIDGATADLALDGTLRFVTGEGDGRRTVRLTALRVKLGRDSTLSGRLSQVAAGDARRARRGAQRGGRRALFDLEAPARKLAIDPAKGLARLQGARVVRRSGAARAVSRRLGVAIPRGPLGRIRVSAATVSLGNDVATPRSGPLGDEPPLLPRPASAVDVTGGTLTWHVRDSWIRYVNTEATPEALEGATAEPAIEESSHPCPDRPAAANPTLVYSWSFPFSNGWYDAASGTAALYYRGGIRFTYPSRGIDLTTRNPEIEIDDEDSRAIFRLRGAGETPYPDRRAPLLDLATAGPPSESATSTFGFPDPVRGKLTSDGQNVFADFYPPPNDGFGCVSVSFATNSK